MRILLWLKLIGFYFVMFYGCEMENNCLEYIARESGRVNNFHVVEMYDVLKEVFGVHEEESVVNDCYNVDHELKCDVHQFDYLL
mgnify:CR=1 FL=1